MRVELAEILRCPAVHDASALITLTLARESGVLMEGLLGCPVCGAEYPLRDGAVAFATDQGRATSNVENHARDARQGHPADVNSDDAMRLAALLRLDYAALPVVHVALLGSYAQCASTVARITSVHVITVNADAGASRVVDTLWLGDGHRLPFGDQSLVGAAVDAAHAALLADVVRVVRPGGRVVAPADVPVPLGCRELVRDDREWVGEVISPTTVLRRGAPAG